MIIGVLREPSFETRVSLLAEAVVPLAKKNLTVYVETGAGAGAFCTDTDYEKAGAQIKTRSEVLAASDVLLAIHPVERPPAFSRLPAAQRHPVFIGVYQPLSNPGMIGSWAQQGDTVFSLDLLPRTTRAQAMDVLSSQANIAGYKAVLLAAGMYPRYFPMFMTAAGSIAPAKVLILGAGVAGLQAVATARRLGAVVEVFDTRPSVKEEVMSLGAKFVEVEGAADASRAGGYAVEQSAEYLQKQQQRIADSVAKSDIIITTAQIPGKKAPVLISVDMLNSMRKGSVVVDLAAATGGNTPLTKNNETVLYNGITIAGHSNLAATMPADASKLYGKNILNFLQLLIDKDGSWIMNLEDELVKRCCVIHEGKIRNEKMKTDDPVPRSESTT
ncbi:NAD(P) transhydrogenase subunit alpha [Niabella sp. CC-SYL272]|uniref:NAD(P) transhydrogenase subunit alpha n=1 Tax=Niabella agricola TaxID=2891571 RepID=UPI001F2DB1E3|nr:NAD(P) transhydrogenase subunit alpha [Niabella agricola]MCF3107775.1 NAD(P) transhydrogenase subunit alpha [Niabella agricola]